MDDHEDSSNHTDSSLSSDTEGEQQSDAGTSTPVEQGMKAKSKQLWDYYRKTEDRKKRKYTPFADQEKPSKQLRSYHAKKEKTGRVIPNEQEEGDDILTTDHMDTDDEYGKGMSDSGSESEELNSTTSSCDLSASTDLSSDTMSESEDTDEDEQEQVHEEITDETCSNIKAAKFQMCCRLF